MGTKRLIALATALLFAGCSLDKQAAPPLVGPSELGLSVDVTATPDILTQDGQSQSTIQIFARDASSVPVSGLTLRADVYANGQLADFGTISSKTVSTGSDGKATMVYRAPKPPSLIDPDSTLITIVLTPVGTNFAGSTIRQAELLLVRPGTVVPPGSGPQASFIFSPSTPREEDDIFFDGSASTGNIVSYSWSFGDGRSETNSGPTTRHRFGLAGTYSVTLTVKDDLGRTQTTAPKDVKVTSISDPTADLTFSPTQPVPGDTVFFNASGSKAAAGRTIVEYSFDFGDGSPLAVGSGPQAAHPYPVTGTYTVVLRVKDDTGRTGSKAVPVPVKVPAPPAP